MSTGDDPGTVIKPSGYDAVFDALEQTAFDPVEFLNNALPTLTLTSQSPATNKQSRAALLQTTSTDSQTLLTKLNTHNIRSSSELTTLTDEILRSGNRLAYEVEVLRGDANNLYELLTDTLKHDIAQFVISDITPESIPTTTPSKGPGLSQPGSTVQQEPAFIQQLRNLGLVKARLESVINVFGEAMKWLIPPSEVSMASNLISVSAPELGVVESVEDDKAREYTRLIRNEITMLLDSDGGGYAGLEAASKRVDDFRLMTLVWRGTAEEKARTRVVDGLAKLVEDRKKLLDARHAPSRPSIDGSQRSSSMPGRAARIVEGSSNVGAGLFRNLQKLRDEIYLE